MLQTLQLACSDWAEIIESARSVTLIVNHYMWGRNLWLKCLVNLQYSHWYM